MVKKKKKKLEEKVSHSFLVKCAALVDALLGKILTIVRYRSRSCKGERILIMRYDRISDVVTTLPALERIRRKFPHAKIDIVVRDNTKDLLLDTPHIDGIIIFDNDWMSYKKNSNILDWIVYFIFSINREFKLLLNTLQKEQYDLMIDFTRKRRNLLLALLLRIPHRWGFKIPLGSFLLTKQVQYDPAKHVLFNNMQIIDEHEKRISQINFHINKSTIKSANELLKATKLATAKHPVIGIHLGFGKSPYKSWPQERYHELMIQLIKKKEVTVVFVGSRDEQDLAESVIADIKERVGKQKLQLINLVGQTTLPELVIVAKTFDLFIGTDTGPTHMIGMLDIPVIALFGKTREKEWHPYNKKSIVLKKSKEQETPFFNAYDNSAMKLITVNDVLTAATAILKREKRRRVRK